MSTKTCIECKHLYFNAGDGGYSEWTPGWPPICKCDKGHWEVDFYLHTEGQYRAMLLKADGCPDFKHYKAQP